MGLEQLIFLGLWVEEDLKKGFEGRIISINVDIIVKRVAIQGTTDLLGKPMSTIDRLIAVTGLVHHCIVVTRNISDMEQSTVELLIPWIKNA